MLPAILICAFMVKNAATQTVTTTLDTTSCVMIGDDVKLLCTVSSGCCSSSARVWEKGSATPLLNDGVSTDPSKYVEDYDNGTTGFNLIIKNVQKSDLLTNYKCVYGLKETELFLDDILCTSSEVNESALFNETTGGCCKCAGTNYGWSVIGTAIGTVIILIIVIVKKVELGTVLIVGELTFIISAVVNISVALPIGIYVCHCVILDGKAPWFIVLGLGTSVITGVIIIITIKLKQVGKLKTVLIVGGVIVIISAVVNLFALLIGYYTCHCVGGCWKCAGEGYGWSVVGTLNGTVIIIIAKVIIRIVAKVKICDTMCASRDGLLFIIGVVFSAIVALPIGYCMCQCVDETNPWLILPGLVTSLIVGVISITYKQIKGKKSKQDGDQNEKDETD